MMMPKRLVLMLASCLLAAGCGGPTSVHVSGEVTFDGKPLPRGQIYFNPDFTKGNDGQQGYTQIYDGKFDTRAGGQGACGGPTVVVIQGFEAHANADPKLAGPMLFKEFKFPIDLPMKDCTQNFSVPAAAADSVIKRPPRKL